MRRRKTTSRYRLKPRLNLWTESPNEKENGIERLSIHSVGAPRGNTFTVSKFNRE